MYADDTDLFRSNRKLHSLLNTVQNESNEIHTWFCVNKLSLNVSKTSSVAFRSFNKSFDPTFASIYVDGTLVPLSSTAKFLGIYIDKNLS